MNKKGAMSLIFECDVKKDYHIYMSFGTSIQTTVDTTRWIMALTQCGVFMCYKCSKQIMYMWKKQNHIGVKKDYYHPSLYSAILHQSHWFRLGSLTATWYLTYAASLCPGLAALGTLRWALPSPSSFLVAPQAPPKEECRFQVRRKLAS